MKRPARARTFCGNLLLNPRGTSRRQVRFAPHPDGVRTRRRLCHTPSRVTRKQQAGLVPHTSQRSNGRPLVFRVSRRRWLASCCWPRPRPPRRRSSSRLSRACAPCRRGRRAWRLARDLELSVLTCGQSGARQSSCPPFVWPRPATVFPSSPSLLVPATRAMSITRARCWARLTTRSRGEWRAHLRVASSQPSARSVLLREHLPVARAIPRVPQDRRVAGQPGA